jgi:mannose-6-phosphate isomerase-like protein (cupin superfamily)
VLFTIGERTSEAKSGDIVVVPANAPHNVRQPQRDAPPVQHPVARIETKRLE